MAKRFFVHRLKDSHQWGVFEFTKLVEGGFFSRCAAESCAYNWQREHDRAQRDCTDTCVAPKEAK